MAETPRAVRPHHLREADRRDAAPRANARNDRVEDAETVLGALRAASGGGLTALQLMPITGLGRRQIADALQLLVSAGLAELHQPQPFVKGPGTRYHAVAQKRQRKR